METKTKRILTRIGGAVLLTAAFAGAGVTSYMYQKESAQNAAAEGHIVSLTSDVAAMEAEIAELNRQIETLQDDVVEAQDDYSELHNEHLELRTDYSELKEEHTELQSDMSDISTQLSGKESELQTAVEELENKNRRIASLEKKVIRQNDRYGQTVTEKEELEGEKEELLVNVQELETKIALLEADIVTLRTAEAIQAQQLRQAQAAAAAKPAVELAPTAVEPAPTAEPVQAAESEPVAEPETVSEPEFSYETSGDTNTDKLMNLLRYGAPQRWFANGAGGYYLDNPKFIAYGYYDLTTGETIGYNNNVVYYSASLIKAPYIYSVLLEVSEFEKKALRDGDGKIVYGEGEEKYNLDEMWTFDPETMMEAGSGEIQAMPAGTQMTWKELFAYVLLYSDNVAWNQIMDRFGFGTFYSLVGQLGIQGTASDFMDLSVDDCIKFLREIYKFFETGDPYAQFMKENMMKSKHDVMICASYPEDTVPHKYGWDKESYHDMAIICDERPYILVFMSDMHDGSDADNAYIKEIVGLTKLIHAEG